MEKALGLISPTGKTSNINAFIGIVSVQSHLQMHVSSSQARICDEEWRQLPCLLCKFVQSRHLGTSEESSFVA